MADYSAELLEAICEIRDLVRLLAEPAVAERDRKLRDELRRIVGRSQVNARAVLQMDWSQTQKDIHKATRVNQGNLSTLVKRLIKSGLVAGDPKKPKLVISIPPNFFEAEAPDGRG